MILSIKKEKENKWLFVINEESANLGILETIRILEKLNDQILEEKILELELTLDIKNLLTLNSSIIAQFILLQMSLVRTNGVLFIINASLSLQNTFDVVVLDKIVDIKYIDLTN